MLTNTSGLSGDSAITSICGGATVYANQLDRVSSFYATVCGLSTALRERDFVVLEKGPLQLVVVRIPDHVASIIQVTSPPVRREDTALKLMFVVESIAGSRAAALELGGVIDAVEREWEFQGVRVCDGHDPEGNVIQVREHRPARRESENGR